jgi:hypothetical protein
MKSEAPRGEDGHATSFGEWWRFERYEIRGEHICPAPRAKLIRYDPWEKYHQARAGRRGLRAPHEDLIRVAETLTFRRQGEALVYAPAAESEERILSWCNEYGMLGILPQELVALTLQPRSQDFPKVGQAMVQHRYFRDSGGWRTSTRDHSKRFKVRFDEPGALIASRTGGGELRYQQEGLDGLELSAFFPSLSSDDRASFLYPEPLSEQFWKLYAEPTGRIMSAALGFRTIADDFELKGDAHLGRRDLNELVRNVHPRLVRLLDGRFRKRWAGLTLLASLGMMLIEDLSQDWTVRKCEACELSFMAESVREVYCSTRCRNTQQKRRKRERERSGHEESQS